MTCYCFRVMAFVQKAVARLYEPDKLETLLRDLGKKHYHYGAKQKYVDVSIIIDLSRIHCLNDYFRHFNEIKLI